MVTVPNIGFSQSATNRIQSAEIKAGIDLANKRIDNPYASPILRESEVIGYLMIVVLAFGREACQKAKSEIDFPPPPFGSRVAWDAERASQETRKFLEAFTAEAFREKDGRSLLGDPPSFKKIMDKCLHFPEWLEFQNLLLEVSNYHETSEQRRLTAPLVGVPESSVMPIIPLSRSVPFVDARNATAKSIEENRHKAELTQEQLATLMGLHPSSVYRHESGQSIPQPWRIGQYSRVLSESLKKQVVIPETPIKRK